MFRLADETTLERVEGALLRARDYKVQVNSWWWSAFGVLFIVVSMGFFLYARVKTPPVGEVKRIEFEPQTWYSATKHIRSNEYETQRQPMDYRGPGNWEPEAGAPV